jgi:hypothetical protein
MDSRGARDGKASAMQISEVERRRQSQKGVGKPNLPPRHF